MELEGQGLQAQLADLTARHEQLAAAHAGANASAEQLSAALAAEQEAHREAAAGLEESAAKASGPSCLPLICRG